MTKHQLFFQPLLFAMLELCSCHDRRNGPVVTPWGSTLNANPDTVTAMSLNDVVDNGELIMVTISGPDTYYDFHGSGMGVQYLLCQNFCNKIGVSLRVEVTHSIEEMITMVNRGEADIIAYPIPASMTKYVIPCGVKNKAGTSWAVGKNNSPLAEALNQWFTQGLIEEVKKEEKKILANDGIWHKTYIEVSDRNKGIISPYDALFQRYAPIAHMDWRLMAAVSYHESGFDKYAKSAVGYCGLMAIMPSTAKAMNLSQADVIDPERNISASANIMASFERQFRDIPDATQRTLFVLAAYDAGPAHIRDAMALTKKKGGNPKVWTDVAPVILRMSSPEYYMDPVVKSGYVRGSEVYNFLKSVQEIWADYRSIASERSGFHHDPHLQINNTPHRANRRYWFHL